MEKAAFVKKYPEYYDKFLDEIDQDFIFRPGRLYQTVQKKIAADICSRIAFSEILKRPVALTKNLNGLSVEGLPDMVFCFKYQDCNKNRGTINMLEDARMITGPDDYILCDFYETRPGDDKCFGPAVDVENDEHYLWRADFYSGDARKFFFSAAFSHLNCGFFHSVCSSECLGHCDTILIKDEEGASGRLHTDCGLIKVNGVMEFLTKEAVTLAWNHLAQVQPQEIQSIYPAEGSVLQELIPKAFAEQKAEQTEQQIEAQKKEVGKEGACSPSSAPSSEVAFSPSLEKPMKKPKREFIRVPYWRVTSCRGSCRIYYVYEDRQFWKWMPGKERAYCEAVLADVKNMLTGASDTPTYPETEEILKRHRSEEARRFAQDPDVEGVLTEYEMEIASLKRELSEKEAEVKELKDKLFHTEKRISYEREEQKTDDELYVGEKDFLLDSILREWLAANENSGTSLRKKDVVRKHLASASAENPRRVLKEEIGRILRTSDVYSGRVKRDLAQIGFVLEKGERSDHFRVYPTGHPEYACVIAATPSETSRYVENSVSEILKMLF